MALGDEHLHVITPPFSAHVAATGGGGVCPILGMSVVGGVVVAS
jgi:hypothetical protein